MFGIVKKARETGAQDRSRAARTPTGCRNGAPAQAAGAAARRQGPPRERRAAHGEGPARRQRVASRQVEAMDETRGEATAPDQPGAGEAGAHGRRLALSTLIFSLSTGLSRVLGLVREIVAAYYFGAAGRINAFTVSFHIPTLILALVADAALSSAFVPVFSELLEKGERKRAWRVASSLFWLMLLGLGALTAIYVLVAPSVIGIFGNPGHDRALAVGLSRVLFPIVALLGVSGIVVGILNSYEHFTVPAISPVFWNLAIIAG